MLKSQFILRLKVEAFLAIKGKRMRHATLNLETTNSEDTSPYVPEKVEISTYALTVQTPEGKIILELPSREVSYTDFVTTAIEILLIHNRPALDNDFVGAIRLALQHISKQNGVASPCEEEESEDLISAAIEEVRNVELKTKEAQSVVDNLPEGDELQLQILSLNDNSFRSVERLLANHTDMPPRQVTACIKEAALFKLSNDKAKELYVQLRTLDVFVAIKSPEVERIEGGSNPESSKKTAYRGKRAGVIKSKRKLDGLVRGNEFLPSTIFPNFPILNLK